MQIKQLATVEITKSTRVTQTHTEEEETTFTHRSPGPGPNARHAYYIRTRRISEILRIKMIKEAPS